MKTKLLILTAIGFVATLAVVYAASNVKETGAGLWLGSKSTDKVGFFGATPVVRQTLSAAPTVTASASVTGTTVAKAAATQVALSQAVKAAETQVAVTPVRQAVVNSATISLDTVALTSFEALVAGGGTQTVWAFVASADIVTNATANTGTINVLTTNDVNAVFGFADTTAQVIQTQVVNTAWGFATTTPQVLESNTLSTVYGYSTAAQADAIRLNTTTNRVILTNLGLAQ